MQEALVLSPDTPIILLTAHGSIETVIEALRIGAHDYLIKSAVSKDILTSVAKGLSRREERKHKQLPLEQLDHTIQNLRNAEGVPHERITRKQ